MKTFHAFLVILSLTVLIGSIVSNRSTVTNFTPTPTALTQEVLADTDQISKESIASPTSQPLTPTAQPTPKEKIENESISQISPMLIFPGAKITSQTNEKTVLEVEANPNEIANWYRNKLNELGMKALASSQNNTNGNFQAKIQAAEGSRKYDIEITRNTGENNATIILR